MIEKRTPSAPFSYRNRNCSRLFDIIMGVVSATIKQFESLNISQKIFFCCICLSCCCLLLTFTTLLSYSTILIPHCTFITSVLPLISHYYSSILVHLHLQKSLFQTFAKYNSQVKNGST